MKSQMSAEASVKSSVYCMWSLGLEPRDLERIQGCLGSRHRLKVLGEDKLPTLRDAERDDPVLFWIGHRSWKSLSRGEKGGVRFMAHLPRVLLLPEDCPAGDLEEALDGGFQEVLRGTDNIEKIHEVLRRSLEASNVQRDMERMTREILLDRELLTRKSDVFAFLRDFIVRVSKGMDTARILAEAREVLEAFLPVTAMHAAIWGRERRGTVPMHLYLDATREKNTAVDSPSVRAWTELLLGTATALAPFGGATPSLSTHYNGGAALTGTRAEEDLLPDTRRTLLLPLCSGGVFCGVLALLLEWEYPMGRDQVSALDAAATHLAVLLRGVEAAEDAPGLDAPEVLEYASVPMSMKQ